MTTHLLNNVAVLYHKFHWAAIAFAIPWYVVLRSFHLSADGGIL